jgi:hypothetical protein
MAKIVNKRWAENCLVDLFGLGPDMSDLGPKYLEKWGICSVHPETFFSTLIIQLGGTKLDETWTQGSPQQKEQVPKEVFTKSKDFLLILDELKECRFWGKWEKSVKSNGLVPWIHSKVGGR